MAEAITVANRLSALLRRKRGIYVNAVASGGVVTDIFN